MLVTGRELETYQTCSAKWHFGRQLQEAQSAPDLYLRALRQTLYKSYAILMGESKLMRLEAVRDRWDKLWWGPALESGMPEEAAMKIAGDGWILLSKYYNEVYSRHTEQVVGVNFDFSLQIEGIDFRAHADVISVDPAGQVTILEFGDKKSQWQVYVSLKTKLELCALAESLGAWPAKTRYFNLSHSKTSYSEHLVEFDQHYKDTAAGTITGVARMLKSGAIYCVPNEQCSSCPYQGKCWV